jgi:hypothetical protein
VRPEADRERRLKAGQVGSWTIRVEISNFITGPLASTRRRAVEVVSAGKLGYVDKSGQLVVPPRFDVRVWDARVSPKRCFVWWSTSVGSPKA